MNSFVTNLLQSILDALTGIVSSIGSSSPVSETLVGSRSADGITPYYLALGDRTRWSIEFVPTVATTEVIALSVHQSNENIEDIEARDYTDVTVPFFGVASFVQKTWIEPEMPTLAKSIRIDVEVSGSTGAQSQWKLHVTRGS